MKVMFSKKCEYGLQAVLYLSTKEPGTIVSSEDIAKILSIPKEFVSKILQNLTEYGIVYSKKGKAGGFALAKASNKIQLIDVVSAIDGMGVFNGCVLGFSNCSPDSPCPVHDKWGVLRTMAYDMLTQETLDQLKDKTINKIGNL
ncbi:MAG: Rrf2 family transcriptional regulator [Ignavibacteriaceae bacterium]|nr:Rrf2 family transcriptional regulator [Ignavibacteriaceae bacterium]